MSGIFLVSHKIFDSPHFKREPYSEILAFLYLISEANKEEAGRKRYPRGTCHITTRQLMLKWQWPRSKVSRFLHKLVRDDIGTLTGTPSGTLFGILKYVEYQDSFRNVKRKTGHKRDTNRDDIEPPITTITTKQPKQVDPPTPLIFPDHLDNEKAKLSWGEWISYKKDIKLPYQSLTSEQKQLNQKRWKTSDQFCAAIEYSIAQGYKGIYEDRNNGAGRKPTLSAWERQRQRENEIMTEGLTDDERRDKEAVEAHFEHMDKL